MKDQHAKASGTSSSPKGRKAWLVVAMLLAVVGFGLSVYATNHHRQLKAAGVTDASCNINQTVNCDVVASSVYSEVLGIPLGVWGGAYFLALMFLLGTALAGHRSTRENLHAYSILVGVGFLVSLVLGGVSYFAIGAACLVCMGIYAVTTLTGVLLVVARNEIPSQLALKSVLSGGTTASIVVAATVCGYILFMPKIAPVGSSTGADQANALKDANGKATTLLPTKADIPITKSAYAGMGEDYRKGSDGAKVEIVEFADFQCPACSRVAGILKQLAAETGDRTLIVFKNYPLDMACNGGIRSKLHEHSCNIAIMARCAGQYGKFWEYHDMAFAEQSSMKAGKPEEIARVIGLNEAQIKTCKESADILAKIKDDIATGDRAGVDSTPTIFINGRKYVGNVSVEAIREEISQLWN